MRQTFYKTIHGHKLEFNRLLYPISYHVFTKDIETKTTVFSMVKDKKGRWNIKAQEDIPGWLNDIGSDIHDVILENEISKVASIG